MVRVVFDHGKLWFMNRREPNMARKIIITMTVLVFIAGLLFVAHAIDFVGILLDIHGG
jgi:hypothetical protein